MDNKITGKPLETLKQCRAELRRMASLHEAEQARCQVTSLLLLLLLLLAPSY